MSNGYVPKGMAQSTRNMWGWDFGRYDKILMVIDDCRFRVCNGDYGALQQYYSALNTLKLNWASFMNKPEKDKYDAYIKMFMTNNEKAKKIYNSTHVVNKYFGYAAFWLSKCDDLLMFIKQYKGFGVPIEFKIDDAEKTDRYLTNRSASVETYNNAEDLEAYKQFK